MEMIFLIVRYARSEASSPPYWVVGSATTEEEAWRKEGEALAGAHFVGTFGIMRLTPGKAPELIRRVSDD